MTLPPEMQVTPAKRSFWRNLSPIWLVPLLAVIVSVGIAWKNYADRGAVIEITFRNAAGVTPGETAIRLRDVPVGVVEAVRFNDDLTQVIVTARVDKNVAQMLPQNASFWVVRPEVSARGISGLNTVLSGVYIEAAFMPTSEGAASQFTGSDAAPLMLPGKEGTRITLRAPDGNRLTPGAPVLYRGIQVGVIESPRLIDGAEGVVFDAFIDAPHDSRLTTATRFWDTSGFSVSLGTGGLRLGIGNLASLLTGGIAFDTVYAGGGQISPSSNFELYPDETTARESVVSGVGLDALRATIEFDGSVQGLAAGAELRYRGIRVGQVSAISARVVEAEAGPEVRIQAAVGIDAVRLGLPEGTTPDELQEFLRAQVAAGLRARLAPARLLGTSLVIELVELPEAAPAELLVPEGGLPIIPSVPADLSSIATSAESLISRLGKLPIEDLMQQAISLMSAAEQLVSADSTRAVPDAAAKLLEEARKVVGSEAVQALPGELQKTVEELRGIFSSLQEQKAVEQLLSALTGAEEAADAVTASMEDVPELIEDLRGLVKKANDLKAEELVAAATDLMKSADELIGTEEAKELPPAFTGALTEVEKALRELREGGVVENLNTTLASASDAATAVAKAAQSLPDLSRRLDQLVLKAESMIDAYGARSPINDEILSTLRDARTAVRAFSQLARTIERNPNSLLFGR